MYSLATFIRKDNELYCTAVIDLKQVITPKEALEITKYTPKDEIHLSKKDEAKEQKIFIMRIIDKEYYIKIQS